MAKSKTTVKSKTENEVEGKVVTKTKKELKHIETVRKNLTDARTQVDENYLKMSELLHETYHNRYYKEWGYESFEDYCESDLDFQYRKAKYYVGIWDKVVDLDLDKERVSSIGWTKMKEIALVITKKNAKAWLSKADKMNTSEVIGAVKTVRRKDTKDLDVPVVTTMKFTLADDQGRVVAEALAEAKKLTENSNEALALEMICQDWLAEKGKVPEVTSLKDMVKYLENVYSVKITAKVDAKAKKAKEVELKEAEAEAEKEKAEAKGKKAAASKKKGGKKKATEEVNVDDLLGGDEDASGGDTSGDEDIDTLLGL